MEKVPEAMSVLLSWHPLTARYPKPCQLGGQRGEGESLPGQEHQEGFQCLLQMSLLCTYKSGQELNPVGLFTPSAKLTKVSA